MRLRAIHVLICALPAVGAAACNANPLYGNATFEVTEDTVAVYALNGTPLGSPSALVISSHSVTRAEASPSGTLSFDIAFDVSPTNQIVIYPAKLVATDARGAATRIVGLLPVTGSFDAMREAPSEGYKYDSTAVVSVGQTVMVDSRSDFCSTSFLPNLYAKLVVDSISAARILYVRIASSLNCGFRQLVPGEVPEK